MNKTGAKRAKASDFKEHWASQKEARAARFDLHWRADDLAETDIWRRRNAEASRSRRP